MVIDCQTGGVSPIGWSSKRKAIHTITTIYQEGTEIYEIATTAPSKAMGLNRSCQLSCFYVVEWQAKCDMLFEGHHY